MISGLWKKDIALSKIEVDLENCELYSFDIFDTLLFRAVKEPKDLFLKVGKEAINRGYLRKGISPIQFSHIRTMTQKNAKKNNMENKNGEYTIHEVYSGLHKNIGDSTKILELELELERKFTYLNYSIYSLISYLKNNNKKVILTSDMYLNDSELKEILVECGFDLELIEAIEVSCVCNKSKAQSNLYEHLSKRYGVPYHKIFHIGDNYTSDYLNAKKFGINAFHYNIHDNPYAKGIEYENVFFYENNASELYTLRKQAANLIAHLPEEERFHFVFGATILGPFLTFFTEWVLDTLEELKIKNLYPFMSEAVFFEKMLQKALKARKSHISFKKMYVSRVSTFLAGIENFNQEFLEKLLFERRNFLLDSLFEQFELSLPKGNPVGELTKKKIASLSDKEIQMLKDFLFDEAQIKQIKSNISQRKEILLKYLKENFDLENFSTLDIGYQGSSASNLEFLLRQSGYYNYEAIHFLAIAINRVAINLSKGIKFNSFIQQENRDSETVIQSVYKYCHMIETIIHNNVLSTVTYKKNRNEVYPVFEEKYDSETAIAKKDVIQEGILFFQTLTLEQFKMKKTLVHQNINHPLELLKIVNRVFELPTLLEAKELGSLFHKNGFLEKNRYQFISNEELSRYSIRELTEVVEQPEDVYWLNGLITLKDPQYLLKKKLNENRLSIAGANYRNSIKLVQQVLDENPTSVCIYGAGEAGRVVASLLRLFDIKINCFVDGNKLLHGLVLNDIEIISLDEVLEREETKFVVGSFSFVEEIKNNILTKTKKIGKNVEIFSLEK
ncbi:hypothetical protein CSV67_08190 [Sporosarcina sp. P2]|uniref:HAD hydrolase-like protein n=1 Tax=Sporosarcina sp. P2 TaxID=2048251 RepID=UPI000C172E54|nr:HAD hydrolase-like protein [Sporosarcina sp. P2]PID02605.1 hypothetical protein CSV67_08190 [Sporosarcina sp. P2]